MKALKLVVLTLASSLVMATASFAHGHCGYRHGYGYGGYGYGNYGRCYNHHMRNGMYYSNQMYMQYGRRF